VRTSTSISTRTVFSTFILTLTATALPSFTATDFQSSTNAAGQGIEPMNAAWAVLIQYAVQGLLMAAAGALLF